MCFVLIAALAAGVQAFAKESTSHDDPPHFEFAIQTRLENFINAVRGRLFYKGLSATLVFQGNLAVQLIRHNES